MLTFPESKLHSPRRAEFTALVFVVLLGACLDHKAPLGGQDTTTPSDTGETDTNNTDTAPGDTGPGDTDTAPGDTDGTTSFGITANTSSATVIPQTMVQLSAEGLPEDAVGYRWSVVQPEGSVSVFRPSAFVLTPTFELNVAGTYTFILEVFDSEGRVLETTRYTMAAVPAADLHVSLTWHTPNDPDETNTGLNAGADLDLHVLRTDLGGDWFGVIHDTFWDSPAQGYLDGSPRPSLDRDDTDGAGPENANLATLTGGSYAVGIHYWDHHEFGSSFATIRIYLRGQLVEEWAGVELRDRDFWHSHNIDPNGVVTRVGNAPHIEPNVNPSDYFQP